MPVRPDVDRRQFVLGGLALSAFPLQGAEGEASSPVGSDFLRALREGGGVVAFRHALAPGTFDPPGFRLGDCRTQRNLDSEGRAQARRIGDWFRANGLTSWRVRSSPWCRCIDTARLAFGRVEVWAPLGSPRGYGEATNAESLSLLRRSVAHAVTQRDRFEVWVTHMFVLQALAGAGAASGEGLLLRPRGAQGAEGVEVVARLRVD